MRSILSNTEDQSDLEVMAILLNLAWNKTAAKLIGEPRGISMLFKRAYKFREPLIIKLLRNISGLPELKVNFLVSLRQIIDC